MNASWIAAAEQLAEDAAQPGWAATALVASAWQARCDPEATRALVQVAYVLTSGNALHSLWSPLPACPSAADYLRQAEELEGETAALAAHGRDMAASCEAARDAAADAYRAAQRQAGSAASETARAEAGQIMSAMSQVTGDCDAALDLLGQVLERLNYAVNCLRRVPADFAGTYDVPLQFIRDGGTLPWSGDFLTAAGTGQSPETITKGA